jgi:hypothetical protein
MKRRQRGGQLRKEALHPDALVVRVLDARVRRVQLWPVSAPPAECTRARTSIVRDIGILYVKLPVLKSDLSEPIEMISFAASTFSFTSGWLMLPTYTCALVSVPPSPRHPQGPLTPPNRP